MDSLCAFFCCCEESNDQEQEAPFQRLSNESTTRWRPETIQPTATHQSRRNSRRSDTSSTRPHSSATRPNQQNAATHQSRNNSIRSQTNATRSNQQNAATHQSGQNSIRSQANATPPHQQNAATHHSRERTNSRNRQIAATHQPLRQQRQSNQQREPITSQPIFQRLYEPQTPATQHTDICDWYKPIIPIHPQTIPAIPTSIPKTFTCEPAWKTSDILRDEHNLDSTIAAMLVELFDQGNTIPFVARHRRDVIGAMTTEELRNVRCNYDRLEELKKSIGEIHAKILRMDLMSAITHTALVNAKSQMVLNEIYAPFKLIDDLNLETARKKFAKLNAEADRVLAGQRTTVFDSDIINAVSIKIACSSGCIEFLDGRCKRSNCILKTTRREYLEDEDNFVNYSNKSFKTQFLKPHQIMAINRAEKQGILAVTLEVDNFLLPFCHNMERHFVHASETPAFDRALSECYDNIAVHLFKRMKRAALTAYAEQAALDVFSSNLKQLLLTAPVRNRRILGMDPGTQLGCKLGLISEAGEMLAVGVVRPPAFCSGEMKKCNQQKKKLRDMLHKHECSLIAIGNGTGCREVETWIADLIASDYFDPLDVTYTIVNESGASVYSTSPEAIREFGKMDPHFIGAISLARRVQDPLSELVKVDPRHLGIGMYQHDVDERRLGRALAAVASECVSLVGVDVNTASQRLLRHVAGLTDAHAELIVARRMRNGDYARRDDLSAAGIGTRTFRQCAGFLRILNGSNRLDATAVHPESYDDARRVLALLGMRDEQIGTRTLRVRLRVTREYLEQNHATLGMSVERVRHILDGLVETSAADVDGGRPKALWFRADVVKMADLEVGMALTGIVVNVTLFGSFVDVGVGKEGLIAGGKSGNTRLQMHDRVKVKVCNLNVEIGKKGKIGLEFIGFVDVSVSNENLAD